MTTSQRLYLPINQLFTNLGKMAAGWKLYTFLTGTTTPKVTYTTPALNITNSNPIILDANGRTEQGIFVDKSSNYKLVVKDQNDVPVPFMEFDPVDSFSFNLTDFDPRPASYWGITTGTSAAYLLAANPPLANYSANDIFLVTFHTASAANATLNIDSLGVIELRKKTGQGTTVRIQTGDVEGRHWVTYDGSNFIILDPRNRINYSGSPIALTIASGAITLTNAGGNYTVDTEAAAAFDEVTTINGGVDGQIVTFRMANAARIPIFHDDGIGNLSLNYLFAPVLTDQYLTLIYDATGAVWKEISRSSNLNATISYTLPSGGTEAGVVNGAFTTRRLNLITPLSSPIVQSLTSNQFTLFPGSYIISTKQPITLFYTTGAGITSAVQSRLRNITDSSTVKASTVIETGPGAGVNADIVNGCYSMIDETLIELLQPKTFALQYYSVSATDLGRALGTGENEIYSTATIKKI